MNIFLLGHSMQKGRRRKNIEVILFEGKETRRGRQKRELDMNIVKIYCIYIWKYDNEIQYFIQLVYTYENRISLIIGSSQMSC